MGTLKKDMLQNVRNMNASDFKAWITKLLRFKCPHGHTGFSHWNCFQAANSGPEKIGFLDIECSGLVANFGVMLSYCILDNSNDKILGRAILRKEILGPDMDKQLVTDCIADMLKFDRLVVHYGTDRRFDFPFIRTRAIAKGVEFPEYGTLYVEDTYPAARNKLRLNSNRQNVITELYEGVSEKTRVIGDLWMRAMQGNQKAINEIFKHNKIDVRELKKNYWKLHPYVRHGRTSI